MALRSTLPIPHSHSTREFNFYGSQQLSEVESGPPGQHLHTSQQRHLYTVQSVLTRKKA